MAAKHLCGIRAYPIRMCVICRKRFPKENLKRYVLSSEQELILDVHKKSSGRGWYVCYDQQCERQFTKFRASSQARRG